MSTLRSLCAAAASVVACLAVAWPAHAQPPAPEPPPSVVTSGEAILQVAPDRAFVTIQAESRARSPKAAQEDNAEIMSKVQNALRGARLASDAIKTISINLQPEYDFRDGRRTLRGYVATNVVDVRVDNTARKIRGYSRWSECGCGVPGSWRPGTVAPTRRPASTAWGLDRHQFCG